jgi:site-specific DNA-methyltransferase (adenine-specific)
MKPLTEKTYIDQALRSLEDEGCGLGGTWLDHCRIPYKSEDDFKNSSRPNWRNHKTALSGEKHTSGAKTGGINYQHITNNDGRFPANLLCSDDVLNDGIKTGAGITGSGITNNLKSKDYDNSSYHMNYRGVRGYGDSGSFSRYFDLDAWFSKRIDELPESVKKTFPFLIVPKASKSEKNRGCEGLEGKVQATDNRDNVIRKCPVHDESIPSGSPVYKCGCNFSFASQNNHKPKKNNHPTVKPIKLFLYLITLGSQPNDTILDPFSGSGTTCIAAKMLGRSYIGIELEEDYITIADARLKAVEKPQPTLI